MDSGSPNFVWSFCCCLAPLVLVALLAVLVVPSLRVRVFRAMGLAKGPAQPTYRPLQGRMAVLAGEAYRGLTAALNQQNPSITDAAELLAAMRFARESISPQYTDIEILRAIDHQLRDSVEAPPTYLRHVQAEFERVQPQTLDVAQAIAVLHYVANSEMYGVPPALVAAYLRDVVEEVGAGPLPERLQRLAATAYAEIRARVPEQSPEADRLIRRAADLVAALRLYRDVVSPVMFDNLIEAGLGSDPARWLDSTVEQYARVTPRTPEVEAAMAVIRSIQTMDGAAISVAFARMALGR